MTFLTIVWSGNKCPIDFRCGNGQWRDNQKQCYCLKSRALREWFHDFATTSAAAPAAMQEKAHIGPNLRRYLQ
jgi:hypothetical protein